MPPIVMASFFPMHRIELWFLVSLVAFSAASFLPWWREIHIWGMSLFGWWMVVLMLLSPAAALLIFRLEHGRRAQSRGTR